MSSVSLPTFIPTWLAQGWGRNCAPGHKHGALQAVTSPREGRENPWGPEGEGPPGREALREGQCRVQTPGPVHSLPIGVFLGLTCDEVSGLSMEHAQGLAMAVKKKNVTLRVNQVSPL